MKLSSKTAILALVLLATSLPVLAADISVPEYQQQVDQLASRVNDLRDHPENAGKLVSEIPSSLTVSTGEGSVTVSLQRLKDSVAEFSTATEANRAEKLEQLQNYAGVLSVQAHSYDKPSDLRESRQKLKEILQHREFNKVHPPGAREVLLDRIFRWIGRLFRHLGRGGKATFNVVQAIVYGLIAVALGLAIFWTVRRLRRPEEPEPTREIIPFTPSARNWRAWLGDARAFAAQNDWRNAIHMAYWAGISFLEAGGAWKPNRARTPREYLRLINSRDPQLPTLSSLTGKFETVWYGQRPAGSADFEETVRYLENLGCR